MIEVRQRQIQSQALNRPRKRGSSTLVIVLQALTRHPVFEVLMESVARHLSLPISAVMTPFALYDADALQTFFAAAEFKKVDVLPESTWVRFPEPDRFVPLAVASSAAAVPAFAKLEAQERAALLESVRIEVDPTIRSYRDADSVTFEMFAHLAVATT